MKALLWYLLGVFTPVFYVILRRIFLIIYYAGKDTCKWRYRHLKPGTKKYVLWLYYPLLFWSALKNQAEAWWKGYEIETGPSETNSTTNEQENKN